MIDPIRLMRNAVFLINLGLVILLGLVFYQGVQLQKAINSIDTRTAWRHEVIEQLDTKEGWRKDVTERLERIEKTCDNNH